MSSILGYNRDYAYAIGYSQITNYRRVTALGNNPSIDTGTTPEDVWPGGGLYPWPTTGISMEILSDNAADTAAGTGARTVRIDGLDINYVEVSQTVTMNGTTAVAIPQQIFRINGALVLTAGSSETNTGTITIRDSGGGTTRSIISPSTGITKQVMFTVPAGYSLQIISQIFGINRSGGVARFATFSNYVRTSGGVRRTPFEISIDQSRPYRHDGIPGFTISEKTDYSIRCTNVTANSTDVTAGWLGVLKLNTSA